MTSKKAPTPITRRRVLQRGVVAVGAAVWVPPIIQSMRIPAYAQQASPAPCIVDGWMTGGGFAFISGNSGLIAHYQLPGGLHCTPDPGDTINVTWDNGKHGTAKVTYNFSMTTNVITCLVNPNFPVGPSSNFNEVTGIGDGTLTINGVSQNGTITFDLLDGGEGNTSNDRVTLVIKDAGNNTVLNVQNQLVDGGNLQAHDGNFAFGDACPPTQ